MLILPEQKRRMPIRGQKRIQGAQQAHNPDHRHFARRERRARLGVLRSTAPKEGMDWDPVPKWKGGSPDGMTSQDNNSNNNNNYNCFKRRKIANRFKSLKFVDQLQPIQ